MISMSLHSFISIAQPTHSIETIITIYPSSSDDHSRPWIEACRNYLPGRMLRSSAEFAELAGQARYLGFQQVYPTIFNSRETPCPMARLLHGLKFRHATHWCTSSRLGKTRVFQRGVRWEARKQQIWLRDAVGPSWGFEMRAVSLI